MQLEPATTLGLPGYYPGARHNPQENLILGAELLTALYDQTQSWPMTFREYYNGSLPPVRPPRDDMGANHSRGKFDSVGRQHRNGGRVCRRDGRGDGAGEAPSATIRPDTVCTTPGLGGILDRPERLGVRAA